MLRERLFKCGEGVGIASMKLPPRVTDLDRGFAPEDAFAHDVVAVGHVPHHEQGHVEADHAAEDGDEAAEQVQEQGVHMARKSTARGLLTR